MKNKIIAFLLFALLLVGAQNALAAGASMYFSSTSGSYTVGQKISLAIYVQPNGQTFDTVSANINFPADKLQVTNFSLNPTFSTPSPDNSYNNSAGTLSYGAGIPGGTDQAIQFGTVTFNVKSSGNAPVSFSTDSAIINAGDSLALGFGSPANFSLADIKPVLPTPKPTTTPPPTKTTKPATVKTPAKNTPPAQANPGLAALTPDSIPVINQAINESANSIKKSNIFSIIGWSILALIIIFLAFAAFLSVRRKDAFVKK